eukprot:1848040-Pyramimonas_sp.AAC.1
MKNRSRGSGREVGGPSFEQIETSDVWGVTLGKSDLWCAALWGAAGGDPKRAREAQRSHRNR